MVRILASLAALVAVGVGAFLGVRLTLDRQSAPEEPQGVRPPFDAIDRDREQPSFEGELLGIFVGPSLDNAPDTYVRARDVCGPDDPMGPLPLADPGDLELALDLPARYVLQPDSMDTATVGCGETIVVVKRNYQVKTPSGFPGSVIISRSVYRIKQYDVSAGRVSTRTFAGREAVVIETVTPDGLAQRSGVSFPEPFGMTSISAFSLPMDELLELAELVAVATEG